jgi:hypothetical protein
LEHHTLIDQQVATFPPSKLVQFRVDHEEWVKKQLSVTEQFTGLAVADQLVSEKAYCTLLPVVETPHFVYSAPCELSEAEAKALITHPSDERVVTPFIIRSKKLLAFADLTDVSSPFAKAIDPYSAESHNAPSWWDDPAKARWYVELLNRTLNKITGRRGLRLDKEHHRFYFEPEVSGVDREASYRTISGRRSKRSVAWNPRFRHNDEARRFWVHLAVGLRFHRLGDRTWVLAIRPERRFTVDGYEPLPPKTVGRKSTKAKSRMYNLDVLEEVQFWRDYLSNEGPRIIARFGSQSLIVENTLLSVGVTWPQIPDDEANRLKIEYEEDLFTLADRDDATHDFEDDELGLDGDAVEAE